MIMRHNAKTRLSSFFLLMVCVCFFLCYHPQSVQASSTKKITMVVGQKRRLKKKSLIWKSKKPEVVRISKNGCIYALKKGTAKVTAKRGKKKYAWKIKVEEPYLTVSSKVIKIKKSFNLKIRGTTKKFKFRSSDSSVIKVKRKGRYKIRVTARKPGTAYITASYGKVLLRCMVTVFSEDSSTGLITLSTNDGIALQTLTRSRSNTARIISSVSSYGQSAPLYINTNGGDGLESIFAPTNNGRIRVPGVTLSSAAVSGTIQKACTWARAVCESSFHGYDNGHGYSGSNWAWTWGIAKPKYPGTGDYCCFSLPLCAYYFAGVNCLGECLGNDKAAIYPPHSSGLFKYGYVTFWGDSRPTSTAPWDDANLYPKCGFKDVWNGSSSFKFKAGDIITTDGSHEQLVLSDGTRNKCEVAEATGPSNKNASKEPGGDQTNGELSIWGRVYGSKINHVWRFTGSGVVLNTVGLTG